MEEALLFIEQNQTWLFLIVGAGCAIYLLLGLRAYREPASPVRVRCSRCWPRP